VSRSLDLTDEQFAALEAMAARTGQTLQILVDRWVKALAESQGAIYVNIDEMFDALDAYAARVDGEVMAHAADQTSSPRKRTGTKPSPGR
jgi:hypothetical protein